MKKDRDCNSGGTPYPVYPIYMPNMVAPINPNMYQTPMMGPIGNINTTNQGNTIEQQLYSLNNQLSSLERRVSNLESLIGNTNSQYNTSNYQVM